MKKIILSIMAVAALVALPMGAKAQTTATTATPINAAAKIIQPITIASSGTMDFGTITSSAAAGTVVLAPAGTAVASGGVTLVTGGSIKIPLAVPTVSVTGELNYLYTITLPASTTLTSGAKNMTVNAFTDAAVSGTLGTLSATGTQTFTIGATLSIAALQTSGSYVGSFPVTVAYN